MRLDRDYWAARIVDRKWERAENLANSVCFSELRFCASRDTRFLRARELYDVYDVRNASVKKERRWKVRVCVCVCWWNEISSFTRGTFRIYRDARRFMWNCKSVSSIFWKLENILFRSRKKLLGVIKFYKNSINFPPSSKIFLSNLLNYIFFNKLLRHFYTHVYITLIITQLI